MKNIEHLRVFFRISNASFEFVRKFNNAFGEETRLSEMEDLHKIALEEIEKDTPDHTKVLKLLERMEALAEIKSLDEPVKFQSGGFVH